MTGVDARISPLRQLAWAVRRELWENRSIYLVPLAVSVVALLGFALSLVTLPDRLSNASSLGGAELRNVVEQPYLFAALALMAVEIIVGMFYCLDALYGERRDRSILFWKSLPVSDGITVLAKASIAIVVLPLLTAVMTTVVQGIMLLTSALVLAGSGIAVPELHPAAQFVRISWINVVHLVAFHGFWYAPLYGWLLLVSAWAPRMPFLWAVLPPVTLSIVERIAFDSTRFATALQTHFLGAPMQSSETSVMTMDMLVPRPLGHLLGSPGLWVGLAVSAMFLLGAVRLRHVRGAV